MEDPITFASIAAELKTTVDTLARIRKAIEESKRETNKLETERLNALGRVEKLKKTMNELLAQAVV